MQHNFHNAKKSPYAPTMHRSSSSCCVWCVQLCASRGDNCEFSDTMVEHPIQVTSDYETRLAGSDYVPRFSYGRRMLRDDGGPNRFFLMYLFCDLANAIQFLKDIGLIRFTMQCNTCGRDMTCCADSSVPEGFRWRCQTRVAGVRCSQLPLSSGPGSSRVNSPSKKLCSLQTTSCVAKKPPVSKANIALVRIMWRIGACFAGKPCWYF